MSLFNNTDDLLKYLAEKSKIYIDETIVGALEAQSLNFQNKIDNDLVQLNALITALEDLSYTNSNNVDIDSLVARVALLEGSTAQLEQNFLNLTDSLNQEIQDRISIMYPTGFTLSDFDQQKYRTILELSSNLVVLENQVQTILNGTGIGGSGESNVQSDWTETDVNSDAYIKNKPQWIQSDYVFYEWIQDVLTRYDVYIKPFSWKVERFRGGTSTWASGVNQPPDTLAKCQILNYI